jgi:hypothetical protein
MAVLVRLYGQLRSRRVGLVVEESKFLVSDVQACLLG